MRTTYSIEPIGGSNTALLDVVDNRDDSIVAQHLPACRRLLERLVRDANRGARLEEPGRGRKRMARAK